jgi:23S rRNA (uracil1939-C5)-methyltransferase
MERVLKILALGAQGDGIGVDATAEDSAPKTFVWGAAPGDVVRATVTGDRGTLVEVIERGARRAPVCQHFGTCGGCRMQHVDEAAYLSWKQGLLESALSAAGIDAAVEPIWSAGDHSRRRATLAGGYGAAGFVFGFHEHKSHTVFDIAECPVLTPALEAALPALRRLASAACSRTHPVQATVTDCLGGLDVALTGLERGANMRAKLISIGQDSAFARLSVNGEVIAMWRKPEVRAGDAVIAPPPGGFLQACANAEAYMREKVEAAIGAGGPTVDLFSGCGTFALPLALTRAVHAVEFEGASLEALKGAAKAMPSAKPVTVEARDLFRRPLLASELARFKSAVADPPRAGAEDQCRQLAKSKVARVALVSCEPKTFARDLKLLLAGGYRLGKIWPVDQFRHSSHLEVVASLRR